MLFRCSLILTLVIVPAYSSPLKSWKTQASKRNMYSLDDVSTVAAMFKLGDTNWDGKMTKQELYGYFQSVMDASSAYIRAESFITVGDRNGDGSLSYTEALAVASTMSKRNV